MFLKIQWVLSKKIFIYLAFIVNIVFGQYISTSTEKDILTTELIHTLMSKVLANNESIFNDRTIQSNKTIKIGYLTNISGRTNIQRQGIVISGAITYAINKINSNSSILGGRKLELLFNDTSGSTLNGTAALLDQWRKGSVAFFGPEDSCEVEATIAAALQLPMISYKCADSKVSHKDVYSTFARTHPPDTQVVRSVIALLSYYQWKKFSIIWENTPQYQTVVKSLTNQAIAQEFTINSEKRFENYYECCISEKPCCNAFLKIVEETYKGTRVYVFLGKTSDLHRMMRVLRMRGLLELGEYIVIYVDLEEEYLESQSYKYINTRSDLSQDDKRALIEASQSLLVIVPSPPEGVGYSDFEEKVREFNAKPPFNLVDPKDPVKDIKWKRHITIYASYLYDSVILYCDALSEVLKEGLTEYDGKAIIRKLIDRKRYLSVTGAEMNLDENGDVEGNYTVLARMPTPDNIVFKGMNGSQRPSHVMLPVGNFKYDESINKTIFKLEGYINWVSGDPPLVEPPCGFDGSACRETKNHKREIFAGVLGGLFVTISIIAAVTYRNWKYEQEIAGLLWKINLRDIQFYEGSLPMSVSKISIASQASVESRFHTQIFTKTATFKGAIVAVKQLKFHKRSFDISRNVKKEMKLMKEIHHDNINPFIGAYIEPSCIYIVTEYCAKGSLLDILENDDLKLDGMFIASLVFDLISGMTFLHDSDIKCHGNLKSSNCVVTSRWVLQITDFGLHQLRANAETDSVVAYNYYRNLLWKAPELLRNCSVGGNQKGDVYAFAIILHEIICREGPWGINNADDTITPKEIIQRVKETCLHDRVPFRPDITLIQCQNYVVQTMQECWSEIPENRPDFRTIRSNLKKLRHGLKSNIMDNMIEMMEKYANNLEEIVEERTSQLVEEKKKTEALLDRMLPKSVASQLMRGEFVIPEAFDAVTIFFSDIVGFTSMSASSTPMEVVSFLNDLYTLFDSIIRNYDVYKVETIGDAYMVVSGLPIRNGDLHSREIASMALELLESVKTFRIRHRPEEILQLRIGIHTGMFSVNFVISSNSCCFIYQSIV
jgi:guanylate cyclase